MTSEEDYRISRSVIGMLMVPSGLLPGMGLLISHQATAQRLSGEQLI